MLKSPKEVFARLPHKSSAICSFWCALLLIVLLGLACKRSSYQSPSSTSGVTSTTPTATTTSNRTLPHGFTSSTPASGHGEVLFGGMTGTSARGALSGALNALATYFDAKPQLLGAVVSGNDDEIEGLSPVGATATELEFKLSADCGLTFFD